MVDLDFGLVAALSAVAVPRRPFERQEWSHDVVGLPEPERAAVAAQVERCAVVVGVEDADRLRPAQLEVAKQDRYQQRPVAAKHELKFDFQTSSIPARSVPNHMTSLMLPPLRHVMCTNPRPQDRFRAGSRPHGRASSRQLLRAGAGRGRRRTRLGSRNALFAHLAQIPDMETHLLSRALHTERSFLRPFGGLLMRQSVSFTVFTVLAILVSIVTAAGAPAATHQGSLAISNPASGTVRCLICKRTESGLFLAPCPSELGRGRADGGSSGSRSSAGALRPGADRPRS
jgi:hypothetical protein